MTEPMELQTWILLYAAQSLFWVWILFGGGAKWGEDSFLFAFLSGIGRIWEEEQIKLYAWLCWIGTTVWFVAGLADPGLRLDW
jgi:hypothetical protein